MKKEFLIYLESVGITRPIRERIKIIYEFYRKIFVEEIADIFVSEYLKKDGTREYENLWFFSEKFFMEAKQFITNDDFDITPIKSRIHYCNIQKQDYDFEKATEKSRLNMEIGMDTEIRGSLKASKENCDYLRDIIFKYVVPNLKE